MSRYLFNARARLTEQHWSKQQSSLKIIQYPFSRYSLDLFADSAGLNKS